MALRSGLPWITPVWSGLVRIRLVENRRNGDAANPWGRGHLWFGLPWLALVWLGILSLGLGGLG